MAGGSSTDVLRSVRRYTWLMLGGRPWTVRTQRTRVEDDARPAAVVEESAPLTTPFARHGFVQGDVQKAQSYAVVCYPALAASAAESQLEAARVRDLLDAGFTRGLVSDDHPPRDIGGPFVIPVYDFAGVPVVGPADERKGPDSPYMHAQLGRAFNVRAIQDPLDELRFTVVANLAVTWWAGGRIPRGDPVIVGSMPPTPRVR